MTIGIIKVKNPINKIKESEIGGRLVVDGYELEYQMELNGMSNDRREYIPLNSLRLQQRNRLMNCEVGDTLKVKYSSTDYSSKLQFN